VNKQVVVIGHYPNRQFAAIASHAFGHHSLTLIYIGRLSIDRGLLLYVDLLRRLREQGIPARLRLAGVFTSQKEEERLRRYCHGLEDALDILQWVNHKKIFALLREADIGLAILHPEPRYVTALPVKLFEYMAAGLPVVASNFAPIASVLVGARCGVTVDPLSPEEAVQRIRFWWEHREEARSAGENGRQAVLRLYNWETLAGKLDNLYHTLLN
jgi:glycosyltransferase involved in cell wall biosynthesis